jgi:hypothetical protein
MNHATDSDLSPRAPIRRFDVFAEVNRLEALAEGRPEDEAKGHGVWLAKVVAGRRFGQRSGQSDGKRTTDRTRESALPARESRFKHAGDELQTDETFDREIVDRMGERFYDVVFSPAVQAALDNGERYEQFRDSIRRNWKPAKAARQTK